VATKDLVKKKTISLTPEVHADLMRVVAAIQAKSGVNTTANDAVRVLLDGWKELERISKGDIVIIASENIVDRGEVVTPFLEEHFGTRKLEL
jgi:hypothetical protein